MSLHQAKTDSETSTVPYRILLVDDQPMIYEALRRMLSGANDIELHYCSEGVDAVNKACEIQPSVILQDLVMPDIDGLMLVKFYHANDKTRDIPIVVLSSREEAKTKAEAFTAGAHDYLVKLPDEIELLARLRYHARAYTVNIERNAALAALKRISVTDALTGLYNRRYFDQCLETESKRAMRDKLPLSLIMLDADHFKQFNDHYGHQAGDNCLQLVAKALQSSVQRGTDIAARYGGEEFAAILSNTDNEGAMVLAERIRQAVVALNIPHEQSSVAPHVTISLGVATSIPTKPLPAEVLLKAADQALYCAKDEGRDRIASAEP